MHHLSNRRLVLVTGLLFLALLAWDASGLDLALAKLSGDTRGFPLKEHWFLVHVLHDGAKKFVWLLVVFLCLSVWWPLGSYGRLDRSTRVQMAVSPLLVTAAVSLLKSSSGVSCPWELSQFGGVAQYAPHWTQLLQHDGGTGACFPAGHALGGFAFAGVYFALRRQAPLAAQRALAAAVLVGLLLGTAQQLRGAHFMSHTLWTGLLSWSIAWAIDAAWPGLNALATGRSLTNSAQRLRSAFTARSGRFRGARQGLPNGRQFAFRHPLWLTLAASAWMGTAANLALWQALEKLAATGAVSRIFELGLALIIVALLACLLNLLSWRFTLKPAVIGLMMASSVGSYFMLSYHVVIDPTMLINVLRTDSREIADLLSSKLLASVFFLGLVPSILVWGWRIDYGPWLQRGLQNLASSGLCLLVCIGAIASSFGPLSSTMRNNHELRYLINPLNFLYAVGYVAAKPPGRDDLPLEPAGLDAKIIATSSPRPPLLLLVLGETARSGNFGVNGYSRNTTPELARQSIVSFSNVWSCGTSTAASVPCMFSGLGRQEFESRTRNVEGLLDIVEHAGMAVLWLDNQSGCQGVCARVGSISTANLSHPSLCPDGECFDGIMLENLDARLAALPAGKRSKGVLLVLHQMGSHGPAYHRRSPAAYKRFLPECTDNYLQNCSRESLLNAYDNSIAYTDRFLSLTINWLKTQENAFDPALMYVADHGESLGENNLYLHGLPWMIAPDVQKHVPWISWMSPAFQQRNALSIECLRAEASVRLTHDHFFHSILGLLGISTNAYQAALDAYARCRHAPA